MLRTVKATIDEHGRVQLNEPVKVNRPTQAIVTLLDEAYDASIEPYVLAESALNEWLRPEEDEAWKHLAELPDLDSQQSNEAKT